MNPKSNPCCVCSRPVDLDGSQVCDRQRCKAVHHICFSGVAEGVASAKHSSTQSVEAAFIYLLTCYPPQKTLLRAIVRELHRRFKYAAKLTAKVSLN